MNNPTTDDYFAFMSDRGASKHAMQEQKKISQPKKAENRSGAIDDVDDSHIEVTESLISDTMVQRIFRPRNKV